MRPGATPGAIASGGSVEQTVRFKARDFLAATNRGLDGRGYEQSVAALERLRGTTITTNIVIGGVEQTRIFGLVESADIARDRRDGRMQDVEVRLSDWVFNAIRGREVLTLHRNYFACESRWSVASMRSRENTVGRLRNGGSGSPSCGRSAAPPRPTRSSDAL